MTTTRRPTTRQLSGRAKSRFLREAVEQAGGGADVSARLDSQIVQVLARSTLSDRPSVKNLAGHRRMHKPETAAAPADPVPADPVPANPVPANPVPGTIAHAAPPPFDPYAFSAMAVLLNDGRPALEALLAGVTRRDQFVQLAEAQSVRLETAVLANRKTSLKAMRSAFIDAVEKRIAHRRAVSG
jgi:hypothetical protein